MTTAGSVIHKAMGEVAADVTEPGTTNQNPYSTYFGRPPEPWCDDFASWCYSQSGLARNDPYCPTSVSKYQSGQYGSWSTTPVVGAQVFYSWTRNGTADHTGIVVQIDGDKVWTVEGNAPDHLAGESADEVAMHLIAPSGGDRTPGLVLGYGIPPFAAEPTQGVPFMFNPPIVIVGRIVDAYPVTGGTRLLTDRGFIYEWGSAPHVKGPVEIAATNWVGGGRVAAQFDHNAPLNDTACTVLDTASPPERYECTV